MTDPNSSMRVSFYSLRVTSPQMATEYRSVLDMTPNKYITSAKTNAASTLQLTGVHCCSLQSNKLLLAILLITIAVPRL